MISEMLDYNEFTGELRWKERPRSHFPTERGWKQCNGRDAGRLIDCVKDGYIVVRLNGRLCRAHRVIWEMFNGAIPQGKEIDHINGSRSDNRLCNLRLATRSQNNCNGRLRRDNKSGYKGVCWNKQASKWESYLKVGRKKLMLGHFSDPLDAHRARLKASNEHYGQFARTS
jgi:hypothetical protein